MHPEEGPVSTVAAALQARLGDAPPTALVLGSGLGVVVDRLTVTGHAPAGDLGLPRSTVHGHAGEVIVGTLGEAPVAVVSGRVHLYEGYTPGEVVRYVRALHRWGVRRLLLTCSAGGITEGLDPGVLVALEDHLNLQRTSPLIGPAFGETRFPDLTAPYDPSMLEGLIAAGRATGTEVRTGIYAAMLGPSYETPAEIRMIRTLGGDVVGMSTVPEVLAAAEIGLPVAALAVVSNRAAGLTGGEALSHEEVTVTANEVGGRVADLLEAFLGPG